MKWRKAERAHADVVIGDRPVPVLFEEAATRHRGRVAQRFPGGVHDRSLTQAAFSGAAEGETADLSYGELHHVVQRLGAGFRALGVDPGDRVAVVAGARMEWGQCDLGLLAAGAVVVPVSPDAPDARLRAIVADAGADAAVVGNLDHLERALRVAELDLVVAMDRVDAYAGRDGVRSLAAVYERGHQAFTDEGWATWLDALDPADPAALAYPDEPDPTGVVVTHAALRSNVNQLRKRLGPRVDREGDEAPVHEEATVLAAAPPVSTFQRLIGGYLPFASGATVAYARRADTVVDDATRVRPTAVVGSPATFERLADEVGAGGGTLGTILGAGDGDGDSVPGRVRRGVADRLAHARVRRALGGRVAWLLSDAPLTADLHTAFDASGLPTLAGYCVAGVGPVVALAPPEERRHGTGGVCLPGVEIRTDTEGVADGLGGDEGYTGVLLVRGPGAPAGYWRGTPGTVADGDGPGFRTGDVVTVRPDGHLELYGREPAR